MKIWSVLGVKATTDQGEIRRAYSRKLKETNPEDDPDGFQKLRAAYEQAMRQAAFARQVDIARQQADEPFDAEAPAARSVTPAVRISEADAEPETEPAPKTTIVRRSPVAEPEPAGVPSAADAHEQACQRLYEIITAAERDDTAAEEALRAILTSPAMEAVSIHSRTEAWLGAFLPQFAPRTDHLLAEVSGYFRWDPDYSNHPGHGVLARQHDVQNLRKIAARRHPYNAAYRALTQKPQDERLWRNWLTPGLGGKVANLLAYVREQHPSLLLNFNQEALAWWEKRAARPHVGPWSIWTMVLAPLMIAWVTTADGPRGLSAFPASWFAWQLGVGAAVLGRIFLIERPRHSWRTRKAANAAWWQNAGWAPASILLVLLAGLLPPSDVTSGTLAITACTVAVWALYVGQPDRRYVGEAWAQYSGSLLGLALYLTQALWRSNIYLPWQARSIFTFFYLSIFVWAAKGALPPDAFGQMIVPIVAAGFSFSIGAQSAAAAWFQAEEKERAIILMTMLVLTSVTAGLLWLSHNTSVVAPAAVALVSALVLAHKAPAYDLPHAAYTVRDRLMRFGWVFAPGVSVTLFGDRAPMMGMFGLWMLLGVGVAVVSRFRAQRLFWDRLFDGSKKIRSAPQDA